MKRLQLKKRWRRIVSRRKGRKHPFVPSEYGAQLMLASVLKVVGGRLEIPYNVIVAAEPYTIHKWDDPIKNVLAYELREGIGKP